MDYKVENVSSIKRKVQVTVLAEEVEAAIVAAATLYRKDADVKGFRKGKVPSSLIESRFKKQIQGEAAQDLINVHINTVMNELDVTPISQVELDITEEFERGKAFSYAFSFEILPEIELPNYKGLAVEEEESVVSDEMMDKLILKVREQGADYILVKEPRPTKDSDVVILDFDSFENGVEIPGMSAKNFELPLGTGGSLPEFEEIVRGMTPGETREKDVTFPADFFNPELAGKTVSMRVNVHSIKEKQLPIFDDEFAQGLGAYKNVDDLKESLHKSYIANQEKLMRGDAEKKLIDIVKSKVEVELPSFMVKARLDSMIGEVSRRLQQIGKSIESTGRKLEDLKAEYLPQAEDFVKTQLLLMAIAKKENLSVTMDECNLELKEMAIASGQDLGTVKDYYEKNNLMIPLRDKMTADKAMNLIYDMADVTKIPPVEKKEN